MQITTEKIGGGTWPTKHQLQIKVTLGLPAELKVICRSASRNDTSYEIFDQDGKSMGCRQLTYATGRLNAPLVDDLNVLLDEFGKRLDYDSFEPVSKQVVDTCEARYGYGLEDGDVIITIH